MLKIKIIFYYYYCFDIIEKSHGQNIIIEQNISVCHIIRKLNYPSI